MVNDTDYLVAVAFVKLRDVFGSMWTVTFLKRKCWKNGQHKNQFDTSQAVLAAQRFSRCLLKGRSCGVFPVFSD